MAGGEAGYIPAYVFALINYLYISGHSRFEGPAEQLAEALVSKIRELDGEVLPCAEVTSMQLENGRVQSLTTADGRTFPTECVVSSIHPQTLLKITDSQLFTKASKNRILSAPNNYSAFCVYVVFKPGQFPYINHPCYYLDRYESVWNYGKFVEEDWPQSFAYLTPCERGQGEYARMMELILFMPSSIWNRWEDTFTGQRGDEYNVWKQRLTDMALQKLERLYPGFRDAVAYVYDASPLTVRDYYNEPDGSLYGLLKDCENPYSGYVPVRTKAANLFLTGQNVYLHGCCGVPLTAVMTAEAVMGEEDRLVKRMQCFLCF